MTGEDPTRKWLTELSGAMGEPPPELETKLRRRFRSKQRKPRPWLWAAAAALVLGIGLGAWLEWDEPPKPVAKQAAPSGFFQLDYGRPTREITSGRLVRVTLPPTAPAWFGLPVDPSARQGIEAEVLLGDDGVAQAVRFVE